jgi:chemotaxis protein methyltransferase CheR
MMDLLPAQIAPITEREFSLFQRFIFDAAGIFLAPGKKALVSGRLAKRLAHFKLASYGDYFKLVGSGMAPGEAQVVIDLLTTNETYFFREPKHFDLLRTLAQETIAPARPFRVWSAACASGEEAYSIAMVLDDVRGAHGWEVVGTDISARVLVAARSGHYLRERTAHVPPAYLQRYCLRGVDEQEGTVLVERSLRQRVQFHQVNLNGPLLPDFGLFDVIFLRNVLIYFDLPTKARVVARLAAALRPGAYLLTGHAESLHGMHGVLRAQAPSVYRKP